MIKRSGNGKGRTDKYRRVRPPDFVTQKIRIL